VGTSRGESGERQRGRRYPGPVRGDGYATCTEQVNELHKLAHLLQAGYSTHLDNYEQMQRDVCGY
jgi:hypothetical protein